MLLYEYILLIVTGFFIIFIYIINWMWNEPITGFLCFHCYQNKTCYILTIFFSPRAPMKRVWNPLLPQINIKEQFESLCKRQILWKPLEPTLSFDIGTDWIQYFFGYMLISLPRYVVVSLFRDSYFKSIRLGGFKSVENDYLNGDVTPRILWNFQN